MKKYLVVLFFLTMVSYSFGQDQISIKISPAISYNRIHTNPDTTKFVSDGFAFRGKIGGLYDWTIRENYYLSGGAFFVAKQIGVKNSVLNIQEHHEVQSLQVPLLLKLYTSEITLDTRLYVELGITAAWNIHNRITKILGQRQLITKLCPWEIGGTVSIGVEYNLSLFTSIFADISYQPALSSIFLEQINSNIEKLFGYADIIAIEFGVRF